MGLSDTFDRRLQLTIPAAQVGAGGVSNYSVIVASIPSGSAFWDEVQADGGDVRLSFGQSGDVEHAADLITIDRVAKTIHLVVGPQTLSAVTANTDIWLWWDSDPSSTHTRPARTDTYGRDNAYHSSLVGYWPLHEDPSGTAPQMKDRTSNANNATSTGSMTTGDSVAGKIGNALDFDGSDDYLTISDAASLRITGDVTVAFWANPTSVATSDFFITKEDTDSGYSSGFPTIIAGSTSNWTLRRGDANFEENVISAASNSIVNSAWQHMVGVYNGTSGILYKDASSIGTGTTTATPTDGGDAVRICTRNFPVGAQPQTKMDEVMVFNRAFTQADVTTLYNNTNAPGTFASAGSAESVGAGGSPCRTLLGVGA